MSQSVCFSVDWSRATSALTDRSRTGRSQCAQSHPQCYQRPKSQNGSSAALSGVRKHLVLEGKHVGGVKSTCQPRSRRTGTRLYAAAEGPDETSLPPIRSWLGDLFVGTLLPSEEEVIASARPVPVVQLEPDASETEGVVESVLSAFHEDTEPEYFQEYKDPPGTKAWDPLPAKRKPGVVYDYCSDSLWNFIINANQRVLQAFEHFDEGPGRREFLLFLAALLGEGQVAAAMAEDAEKKKKSAPADVQLFRLFGASEKDIYYPKALEGYWDVDAVLVNVEAPQGMDKLSNSELRTIQSEMDHHGKFVLRFYNHRGNVIGDRLYNVMSMVGPANATKFKGIWDPDNPDRLRLVFADAQQYGIETNITRRAFGSAGPGTFDCSEFIREVADNTSRVEGPPTIKARQVSVWFKWDPSETSPNEMKVIQKVSSYGLGEQAGETVETLMALLAGTTRPTVIRKYVLKMKRRTEPPL